MCVRFLRTPEVKMTRWSEMTVMQKLGAVEVENWKQNLVRTYTRPILAHYFTGIPWVDQDLTGPRNAYRVNQIVNYFIAVPPNVWGEIVEEI